MSDYVPEPAVELPTGVYSFDAADGTGVMVVATGGPPANSASASWEAPDDAPLIQAYGWFEAWWQEAAAVPAPKFNVKDNALTLPSGQEAVVQRQIFDRGRWSYQVRVEGSTKLVPETGLGWPRQTTTRLSGFAARLLRQHGSQPHFLAPSSGSSSPTRCIRFARHEPSFGLTSFGRLSNC